MNRGQVKQTAERWVADHQAEWPGLRAAHLVGSVARLADGAEVPWYKDVDIHLIFDAGAPALRAPGPFANLLETSYEGLLIEAGLKPVTDYESPETVLANPEIADHLRIDSILYDPDGLLAALHAPVAAEFARRPWVEARCAHERTALGAVLRAGSAPDAPLSPTALPAIAGYGCTFLTALLCVATLRPVTTGGHSWLRGGEILAASGRPDLYNAWLDAFKLRDMPPARAAALADAAAAAFDRAVVVKRSPHPFGHKLYPHLRPYLVETCRSLLADGHPAEAAGWAAAFFFSATDVLQVDGAPSEQAYWTARQAAWLETLGWDTAAARIRLLDDVTHLAEQVFALAEAIVARHPDIRD